MYCQIMADKRKRKNETLQYLCSVCPSVCRKLTYRSTYHSLPFTLRRGVYVSATFRYEGAFEREPSPRNQLETKLADSCKFQLHELLHRVADGDLQTQNMGNSVRLLRRRRKRQRRASYLQGLTQQMQGAFNEKGITAHLRGIINNILHPLTAGSLHQRRQLWKRLQRLSSFERAHFTTKLLRRLKLLHLNSRRLEHSKHLFTKYLQKSAE